MQDTQTLRDGMPPRHVFIVTYGRSGSTLLQNLLNALPGYCVRGENENALVSLFQAWQKIDVQPHFANARATQRQTSPAEPWFGAEATDPDRFGQSLAAAFSTHVLAPPPGTRVSGFKEIRWHQAPKNFPALLAYIVRFFPDSRFIFNTRDPAAVARSGWWQKQAPEDVYSRLAKAEQLFAEAQATWPAISVALHYDTFVADHTALRPLFDLLDEPFDPDLIARVMDQRLTHAQT